MVDPPYQLRVAPDDAFDATIGFVVDDDGSAEIGRCAGRLPVMPRVCQPMGIVHGGVYAAIAETLASMGTARGVLPARQGPARNVEQHELPPAGERGHGARLGARAIHRGRTTLGVGRRDARRPRSPLRDVARHDRRARSRAQVSNKIRVGFFSFTEITDPAEHRSYNEWHQLDHMPEQYPLPGIAYGQRWVSTPACRAARAVSGAAPRPDPLRHAVPDDRAGRGDAARLPAARARSARGRPLAPPPARAALGPVPRSRPRRPHRVC